jgi:hypothetical protein
MAFSKKKENYGKPKVLTTAKVKTSGGKTMKCRGMGAAKKGCGFTKNG